MARDRRTLTVFVAVLSLGGCSEAPDARRIAPEGDVPGRARSADPPPRHDAPDFDALHALGYATQAPVESAEQRGVTRRTAAAYPGANLYTSRRRAGATLIDLEGRVLHRWADRSTRRPKAWMHVEPLPDLSLLVIAMDSHLSRFDRASNRIWRRRLRVHHDVAVRDDGEILALVRGRRPVVVDDEPVPMLVDAVVVLSGDGVVRRRVELLPLMRDVISNRRLRRVRDQLRATTGRQAMRDGGAGDLMHANSIEVLHTDVPGVAPRGSILISFRNLDRIALFDSGLRRLLWSWGPRELQGQHDATQLPGGNLLVFDNGTERGRSRVVEIDPRRPGIVASIEPPGLFSRLRGGAQRLPNGNTLITESDAGRAIEVTPTGEVAWELWNPDVTRRGDRLERGVIYRLQRISWPR